MRAFLPVIVVFAPALFSAEAVSGQETDRNTKLAHQLVELINAGDYAGIQSQVQQDDGRRVAAGQIDLVLQGVDPADGTNPETRPRRRPSARRVCLGRSLKRAHSTCRSCWTVVV